MLIVVGGGVRDDLRLSSDGWQLLHQIIVAFVVVVAAIFRITIIIVSTIHLANTSRHELIHLDPFPLTLAPKRLLKRFIHKQRRSPHAITIVATAIAIIVFLLQLGRIPQQSHGQRLPLNHHAVQIGQTLRHLLSKLIQIGWVDHTRIPEPTTIQGDSSGGRRDFGIAGAIAHHELAADHIALLVADGLAVVVHFEAGDGGGGAGVGGGGDAM